MNRRPGSPLQPPPRGTYFGVYAGYLRDIDDPKKMGRIRVFCPTIMGDVDNKDYWLDWALPSFPWVVNQGTGKAGAFGSFLPAAGAPDQDKWGAHIMFREGDVRFPIWTGVFPLTALNTDELALEATTKLTIKVGANTIIVDGQANTVQINGSAHPLPKWNVFEQQFATAWAALIVALQAANTDAGLIAGVTAALAALQTLTTGLGAGTYDSTKARNG